MHFYVRCFYVLRVCHNISCDFASIQRSFMSDETRKSSAKAAVVALRAGAEAAVLDFLASAEAVRIRVRASLEVCEL